MSARSTPPVPALQDDAGLSRYLADIRKFPMLTAEEEYMLAKRWQEHNDTNAAHALVTSHLRLVAKIAMGYRGYGLPVSELIAEGNIGMMQAVKKFEPERGFRLATYAMWWIRASIQEFILRSWSLVKIGTTSAQKKLFFNLRRAKARLAAYEDGELSPENLKRIASDLQVDEKDVASMNGRLSGGDVSLNAPISGQDGGDVSEWIDNLEDDQATPEQQAAEKQEIEMHHALLTGALDRLNDRERYVVEQRRLVEPGRTLENLSEELRVSRERVRQIEARALEKLHGFILEAIPANQTSPILG